MKPAKTIFYFLLFTSLVCILITISPGCAQIGAPTGGPKDTLPPVLVIANPPFRSVHFNANKIVFTFDEFVDIQDIQNNLLVSPYPKKAPFVNNKLRTITVTLKDSLRPNTTYSLNFGNAVKDINEGNVLKNFTYVFSTGNIIDSGRVSGNVLMASTGKPDSTIEVLLYKEISDTAVLTKKPDYIARLNSKGNFSFKYLPPGDFNIYALGDQDGGKTYNSKTETFAFIDHAIHVSDTTSKVQLYAYAEKKALPKPATTGTIVRKPKVKEDNKLRYTNSTNGSQDILTDLFLSFNKPLKYFDPSGIQLTDSNYQKLAPVNITIDSTQKILRLHTKWVENTDYRLVINKKAVMDSDSVFIRKTDTIAFKTKSESDYGNLVLRFKNFNKSKHPVLEFVQADSIIESVPLKSAEWSNNLFVPGDYQIRVLFDDNNNGIWDPGSYSDKRQPEKVVSFPKILTVKADWDNELEIQL